MMELLKDLDLIDVQYSDTQTKATLVFLDESRGEIREVNFNLQSYDNGKYIDDPEKAAKVEKWCADIFGLTFKTMTQAIGVKKDVYAYATFNSLFEIQQVEKFDDDMVGQIFEAVITEVVDDNVAVRIRFDYEGKGYESKMSYADYVEGMSKWFINPQMRTKQYAKFEEKFQTNIRDKDTLVGRKVMVEVKKAMGKYIYSDIKPFIKKKK